MRLRDGLILGLLLAGCMQTYTVYHTKPDGTRLRVETEVAMRPWEGSWGEPTEMHTRRIEVFKQDRSGTWSKISSRVCQRTESPRIIECQDLQ